MFALDSLGGVLLKDWGHFYPETWGTMNPIGFICMYIYRLYRYLYIYIYAAAPYYDMPKKSSSGLKPSTILIYFVLPNFKVGDSFRSI